MRLHLSTLSYASVLTWNLCGVQDPFIGVSLYDSRLVIYSLLCICIFALSDQYLTSIYENTPFFLFLHILCCDAGSFLAIHAEDYLIFLSCLVPDIILPVILACTFLPGECNL